MDGGDDNDDVVQDSSSLPSGGVYRKRKRGMGVESMVVCTCPTSGSGTTS